MDFVLTLLTDPAAPALNGALVALAREALIESGAEAGTAHWLSQSIACDLPFAGLPTDVAENAVRQYLIDAPVDLCAQAVAHRRKRLLVADMDSTVIRQECIVELADFAGRRAEVAEITDRAMLGDLDFTEALEARAQMLQGLTSAQMERAYRERVTLSPGAQTLVRTMRANGAATALVSGGFTFFTERVRENAGFDDDQANDLEVVDGIVTGRVRPPVLDRSAKLSALMRLADQHAVPVEETMTVGDGANDIAMIQAAGLGVAYHARPLVAAAARARIDHGDLTALLYLQGYHDGDFTTA